MKKLVMTVLVVFCVASFAGAAPFLVCDDPLPEEQVTSYEIYRDGMLIANPAGSTLNYDLVGIAPGQYTFTVKACNIWGCSAESNPIQSPTSVSKPSNTRLVP